MSRTGDCWDNAVAESFFGMLRVELLDHEMYVTQATTGAALASDIDGFYKLSRRHSCNGYHSPAEYELRLLSASGAAQVISDAESMDIEETAYIVDK
jgi:putative transposase